MVGCLIELDGILLYGTRTNKLFVHVVLICTVFRFLALPYSPLSQQIGTSHGESPQMQDKAFDHSTGIAKIRNKGANFPNIF